MMWSGHGGWGAGEWLAMSLMMILFWGAVIALVVWLVHAVRSGRRVDAVTPSKPPADDVLAERYARGEIDDEEYTRRRRVLHG